MFNDTVPTMNILRNHGHNSGRQTNFKLFIVALGAVFFGSLFIGSFDRPAQAEDKQFKVLAAMLYPEGFRPAEITTDKGLQFLRVDNRTASKDVRFVLLRGDGNAVKQKLVTNGKYRYRDSVKLEPGQYYLTVANHPEWVCRIIAKP